MIYEKDLDESIALYQGEPNPSINTCIKLAACYALKHELFGPSEQLPAPGQSYSLAADRADHLISFNSGTEFSEAIQGRDPDDIWPIMDELMSTVQVLMPRLYEKAMRMLQE